MMYTNTYDYQMHYQAIKSRQSAFQKLYAVDPSNLNAIVMSAPDLIQSSPQSRAIFYPTLTGILTFTVT